MNKAFYKTVDFWFGIFLIAINYNVLISFQLNWSDGLNLFAVLLGVFLIIRGLRQKNSRYNGK